MVVVLVVLLSAAKVSVRALPEEDEDEEGEVVVGR